MPRQQNVSLHLVLKATGLATFRLSGYKFERAARTHSYDKYAVYARARARTDLDLSLVEGLELLKSGRHVDQDGRSLRAPFAIELDKEL